MDDDEQQKNSIMPCGGPGGYILLSLSLCKKQNAYSSFNALQNQPLHALRYLRYRTFLIIHSSNSSSNILGATFSSSSFPPKVVSRTSRNPIQFFFLLLLSYLFISTTPKSSH